MQTPSPPANQNNTSAVGPTGAAAVDAECAPELGSTKASSDTAQDKGGFALERRESLWEKDRREREEALRKEEELARSVASTFCFAPRAALLLTWTVLMACSRTCVCQYCTHECACVPRTSANATGQSGDMHDMPIGFRMVEETHVIEASELEHSADGNASQLQLPTVAAIAIYPLDQLTVGEWRGIKPAPLTPR